MQSKTYHRDDHAVTELLRCRGDEGRTQREKMAVLTETSCAAKFRQLSRRATNTQASWSHCISAGAGAGK